MVVGAAVGSVAAVAAAAELLAYIMEMTIKTIKLRTLKWPQRARERERDESETEAIKRPVSLSRFRNVGGAIILSLKQHLAFAFPLSLLLVFD